MLRLPKTAWDKSIKFRNAPVRPLQANYVITNKTENSKFFPCRMVVETRDQHNTFRQSKKKNYVRANKKKKKRCFFTVLVSAGPRSGGFSTIQCWPQLGFSWVGRGRWASVSVSWLQLLLAGVGGVAGHQENGGHWWWPAGVGIKGDQKGGGKINNENCEQHLRVWAVGDNGHGGSNPQMLLAAVNTY